MHILAALVTVGLSLAQLAAGHPGDDHAKEARERREFLQNNAANINHCASKLDALGVTERSIQRRHNMIHAIRKKRGIVARANEPNTYTSDVKPNLLELRSNASCVLSPEETVGPYYVAGEAIRSDIKEDQVGVPLHLDVTFINSATCEPVVDSWIDAWHANATGVYAGVVQEGDEDKGFTWEETWGKTFLRGLQKTDADGAVHFDTIFPGHYDDRTIHVHVMSHHHATPLPNNTIIDVQASYIGQLYFDQDLIDAVEKLPPYNTNQNSVTTNDGDEILQEDLQAGGNPFVQYKLIGDKLEDGIIAWLSYGINATRSEATDAITTYHPKACKPKPTAAP